MNKLIDFLINFKDKNKAKALYVNPQDFEDFAVDLIFNSKNQKTHKRVMVMPLDELSFYCPEKSSRELEVHHFVEKELLLLLRRQK